MNHKIPVTGKQQAIHREVMAIVDTIMENKDGQFQDIHDEHKKEYGEDLTKEECIKIGLATLMP